MSSIRQLTEDYRRRAYANLIAFYHGGHIHCHNHPIASMRVLLRFNRLFARRAKWISVPNRYYAFGYLQNNCINVRHRFANKEIGY